MAKKQGNNPRNKENTLYKALTRLFSGPITKRRRQFYRREKRIDLQKYDFQSATGMPFKKTAYDSYLHNSSKYVFERQRAERYADFDMMTYEPILGSALDIYATEVTACNELEPMLKIDCRNQEIKSILDEFYFNVINVEANLYHWTRTMCKYGDFFLYLDIDEKRGITHVIGLPAREVERMEGQDPTNPMYVQFQWNSGGLTFEDWQVCHFRILGDDRFSCYGMSIYESARRVWRQYDLLKNAMMSFRIVRSPSRRVFYLDVGNIPPEEVEQFVLKFRDELRASQVISEDSRVDLRYDAFPIASNTPIPLLDGRNITIKELAEEFDKGNENWVYSIDDKTHKPLPGKVVWCGKNYTASKLYKIWLDNETYVKTAPEHPFILRDGTTKRADELRENDSLMPLYKSVTKKGYEQVYSCETEKFINTHKFVATDVHKQLWEETESPVVHHSKPWESETNKRNNHPNNLQVMNYFEHLQWHRDHIQFTLLSPENLGKTRQRIIEYNKSELHSKRTIERNKRLGLGKRLAACYNGTELHKQHNEIRRKAQKRVWSDPIIRAEREKAIRDRYWIIPDECIELGKEIYRNNPKINREDFIRAFLNDKIIKEKMYEFNNGERVSSYDKISRQTFEKKFEDYGWNGFKDYKNAALKEIKNNHKVTKIEIIEEIDDVYCMTVVGPNGEEDRHNFAVLGLFENGEIDISSGIYLKNSVENDFVIPVRGQNQTRIETLEGASYVGDVDDVKFLRDEMMAAIKIPASYIIPENGAVEDKTSLAQKDILFAKTIQMIQRSVVNELEKMGVIHLYTLGFRKDDLISFKLRLNNPSKLAALQELEHWRTKFDVASSATEGFFSKRHIAVNLFGLSEEEFIRNQREIYNDKKYEALLEKAIQENGIPGEGVFGETAGGPLGIPGEEELTIQPPEGETPPIPEENPTLLAQPEEPAKRDDGTRKIKVQKDVFGKLDSYETQGSKGKTYSPDSHDRRKTSGPRNQQWDSLFGKEASKNTKRNRPNSAFKELVSLGRGITESQHELDAEKEIMEINNGLYSIIERLQKRDEQKNDNAQTQQET